jgi:hypothetical protein
METSMRTLLAGTALSLLLTGAALAQGNPSQGSQQATNPSQMSQPSSQAGANGPLTVQKLKSDLQNAGFSDVKIMSEAYLVQAKSKDGNPVVMTIGPHGFSAFEAVQGGGSSAQAATTNGAKK